MKKSLQETAEMEQRGLGEGMRSVSSAHKQARLPPGKASFPRPRRGPSPVSPSEDRPPPRGGQGSPYGPPPCCQARVALPLVPTAILGTLLALAIRCSPQGLWMYRNGVNMGTGTGGRSQCHRNHITSAWAGSGTCWASASFLGLLPQDFWVFFPPL